jgi:hypothetical protein
MADSDKNNLSNELQHMSKTLLEDLVKGEIGGKNAAIHAYDKIIWMVRTGFATIVFAGWALLVSGITDNSNSYKDMIPLVLMMLPVTLALALGAYKLDENYVQRKFRVINGLNQLLKVMLEIGISHQITDEHKKILEDVLQVSGDMDNDTYKQVNGYSPAIKAGKLLYIGILLSLVAGAVLFFL